MFVSKAAFISILVQVFAFPCPLALDLLMAQAIQKMRLRRLALFIPIVDQRSDDGHGFAA